MFIKSLKLSGFKSFVDQTRISLTPGITAIVGPNGCGKSNICDSLRWVFGEQSAKLLRGGKMEELIFNGSETRKAVGMAEVSVTLAGLNGAIKKPELASYEEITVTRRLFRSGESAYSINKTSCRLKDIVEIFLDTGISTRSFSIMEQAQVNRLIVSKPLERRYIIEEAAGVIKYKHRRNEALNKLELSGRNLLRIQDITKELGTRMNSLKRQAGKARRYKTYREELREVGLNLLLVEHAGLKSVYSAADEECRELEKEEAEASLRVSERRTEGETLHAGMEEEERSLAKKKQMEYEVRKNSEQASERVTLLEEQRDNLKEDIGRKRAELLVLEGEVLSLSQRYEKCVFETTDIHGELAQKDRVYAAEETKLKTFSQNLHDLERDIKKEEREILDSINEISQKRNRHTEIKTRLDGISGRSGRLDLEIEETEVNIRGVAVNLESHSSLIGNAKEELERKRVDGKLAALRVREALCEVKKLDLANSVMKETLSKKRGLLQSFEELKRKFEGLGKGVRAVMGHKESGRLTGVRQLLVDVIQTAPEYERAIEAALGEKLSGLIVEDMESGVSATELLMANREGKGVFIPLRGSAPAMAPKGPDAEGSAGRALDLLEGLHPDFRAAVEGALGDVLVFSTLQSAVLFSKKQSDGWTLVTLNGIVISGRGIITGGQEGKSSKSLLSKNREIRELGQEVREIEREITDLDQKRARLSLEAKEFEETEKKTAFDIHELEVRLSGGEKERERLSGEAARLKRKLDTLSVESGQVCEEREALLKESAETKTFLELKEGELCDAEAALAEKREKIVSRRSELDLLKEKMSASQVDVAALKAKLEFLVSEKSRVVSEKEGRALRIERVRKEIEESEKKTVFLADDITSKREEVSRLSEERKEAEKEILRLTTLMAEKRSAMKKGDEELKISEGTLGEVREVLGKLKLKRSEAGIRIEHIEKRGREEFSVEPYALPSVDEGFDEGEGRARMEFLRRELEMYGDVNLSAISECEKVEERHTFLKNQEEDLLLSIRSLEETIKKIDLTTGKLFNETFETINENFKKMFRRLFGGGKAELLLVEDESGKDPGIDILVQPPGKRLRNIQLMSAGEKAMTAISILFSVFMVRPSPFCLLDEIDAPLDDANIGRFREMLKELVHETQFVIITHNQRTMTFADSLYGVTMQEHGVSKVLCVDISDDVKGEGGHVAVEESREPLFV